MNATDATRRDPSGLAAANNQLGFGLLSLLAKDDAGHNVFISPLSVAIALTMVYNGAEGATKQAMGDALGLASLDLDLAEVNEANAAFISTQDSLDPAVELDIANSIWARIGIDLATDFVQRIADYYEGVVENLDFADPGAAGIINRWVSNATREKIKELVTPSLVRPAEVILVNAIYFKGVWTNQFDPESTEEGDFGLLGGSVKRCPMMTQSGYYHYRETDEFQAVSLPYGEGRVSMYVFLPKPGTPFGEFQTHLTAETWQHWLSGFHRMEGDVLLPRFKVEYGKDLIADLLALGGPGFAGPDFLGMGAGMLVISNVIHKAFVEVNEVGTEAAAATAVVTLRGPARRFEFAVNRPFFCAIRDNETGALLFTGYVVEPD